MTDRIVSVGDDLTIPSGVVVPAARVTDLLDVAASASQGAKADAALPAASLDASVDALLADSASATSAALSSTYGAAAQVGLLGPRWVFDGDSVIYGNTTNNTATGGQNHDAAWPMELVRLSGGRIIHHRNVGVPGHRLDQRLAAFDTDVAPWAPDVVLIAAGTNDVSQSRTMSAYLADLESYRLKCVGIGARLVVSGIYPKNATASTIAAWNQAILEWARPRGVPLIPFWELADVATGAWPSGWSSDGTHPNATGDALRTIGALAWATLEPHCAASTLPRPMYQGDGIHTNPFLQTLAAANTATVGLSLANTTGTLPAGTYQYKIVAANYWGKNNAPVVQSTTLASPGGVTLTRTQSGTYQRWMVYRTAAGGSTFYWLTDVNSGTATFTDDGSLPLKHAWIDGDFSQPPAGRGAAGAWHINATGNPVRTDPGVRGNLWRLEQTNTGGAWSEFLDLVVSGAVSGNTVEFTCKVRADATTSGQVRLYLRWYDTAGGTQVANTIILKQPISSVWGLAHQRVAVPAGVTNVRLSIEADAAVPWIDVAEVRLAYV